jgi:parvulin-like peptidyl-prolyl isomerase
MSLMAMNRAIKKYGIFWGVFIGILMVGGIAFSGFGRNIMAPAGPNRAAQAETPVATVNGAPVTQADLDHRVEMALRQQAMFGQTPNVTPAERDLLRYTMLNQQVKQEQAMVAAAKKAGVTVNDADIARERDKVWQQARTNVTQTLGLSDKASDADIERALGQQAPGMTVARFKEMNIPEDRVKLQLYQEGLMDSIKKGLTPTADEVKRSYDEIQVRHILIKSGDGGLPEGQAKEKAEKILVEVKANPAKMADLAKQFSDDPGSKDKGGFYDWAPASRYVPEFTKGAMDAGVGKVNPELIKTSYGYHIIKLEGERPGKDLPKDFDKEKQKYIDQYADRLASQKVQAAVAAELPNVKVDITDPALKAAQLTDEARMMTPGKAQDAKYEEALAELGKIQKQDDPYGAAPLQKAAIYAAMKKPKEAIAAYEEALKSGNTVETRLALAQAYLDDKDKDGAKKQLAEAEKLAIPNIQTQFQLAFLWNQAGDKDKAKAAQAKAAEMSKRMAEMNRPPISIAPTKPTTSPKPAASPATSPSPAASPAPVAR